MSVEGKILLEIVTPEKSVIKEEVSEVTAPGEEGEFGVLPGHTPFITTLKIGEIKYRKNGSPSYLAVNWGFAEVTASRVYILVETAEKAEQIDLKRAEAARARAEDRIKKAGKEEIDHARAQAALSRALVRLQVASRAR
ncbi:MAG: ATP synthase F1 subunit epsilon [Deltaproteobacteria bacterium CG2_30_43_15]|nr:MAG: ATP synthase F1 subunit epsilon [Deltaproteobacteria bacterium CG2_30_43_15]